MLLLAQIPTTVDLLPPRGNNAYNAGIKDYDKGYVRYANPDSDSPNLLLVNPIRDDDGNIIMPGYYELVLSGDRETLSLIQAGKIAATMPVFMIQEDKSQEEAPPPMDDKSLKKYKKDLKKKAKLQKKIAKDQNSLMPEGLKSKDGSIPQKSQIYMNATIKYDEEGDYYLIKYERGRIRAWGAIK